MILPAIQTDGIRFIEAGTAKTFPYVGASDFALFRRWLMPSGPSALVEPRLAEWRQLAQEGGYDGPIVLRVFRYAASWNQFGITDPWSYDFAEITYFTEFCRARGFYVSWTCGDSQVVCPEQNGPRGQQEHLNRTCAALVPTFAFLQTCNEPFKNGIDIAAVVPPAWGSYLRETGAYGEVGSWPPPVLDFVTYHGDRTIDYPRWPKTIHDMPVQASVLNAMHGKPAVLNEPLRAEHGSDPEWYERMGLLVAFCAGVTFHSQRGRDGDGFDASAGNQRACAVGFFRGIASGIRLVV